MKKHLLFTFGIILAGSLLQAQTSTQKVLIEEHTGAWCGWCPDGHVVLDNVLSTYPNAIGVMVHNTDGMDMSSGNALSAFYVSGFPMATINRESSAIDRGQWASATSSILSGGNSSVTVSFDSVLYNPTTRKMNVYLRADFTGNETGNLRFNGIIVEDNITGTGSDYNQANYLNGTSGHPMYGLGNPIIGYVHDRVARYYLGSAFGTAGVIPTTVTAGETYYKHYVYTVPAAYDDTELSLVGMVSRYNGTGTTEREIINAESTSNITIVNYNVGIDEETEGFNSVYPNPTTGIVNINPAIDGIKQLTVTNMLGEVVISKEVLVVAGGVFNVDLTEQPAGIYLVKLGSASQRIIKQ